ncbi:hypothetical protein ABK040_011825 [Willaertia magna]
MKVHPSNNNNGGSTKVLRSSIPMLPNLSVESINNLEKMDSELDEATAIAALQIDINDDNSSLSSSFSHMNQKKPIWSFRCSLLTMMSFLLLLPILFLLVVSITFSVLTTTEAKDQVLTQSFQRADVYVSDFLDLCITICRFQAEEIYTNYYMNVSGLFYNSDEMFFTQEHYKQMFRILSISQSKHKSSIFLVDFTAENGDYVYINTAPSPVIPLENEAIYDNMQLLMILNNTIPNVTTQNQYYLTNTGKIKELSRNQPYDFYDPRLYEYFGISKNFKESLAPMDVQTMGESIEERVYVCFQVSLHSPIDKKYLGVTSINVVVRQLANFMKSFHVSANGFAAVVEIVKPTNPGDKLRKRVVAYNNYTALAEPKSGNFGGYRIYEAEEISDNLLRHIVVNVLPNNLERFYGNNFTLDTFSHNNLRYSIAYGIVSSTKHLNMHWVVFITAPEIDFVSRMVMLISLNVGLSIISVLFSMVLVVIFSTSISKPLLHFSTESKAISKLEVAKKENFNSSIREILSLSEAFEKMKTALRSFKKFVPTELVKEMVEHGIDIKLGGKSHEKIAIFFSDIADFTQISEMLEPEFLIKHVGAYFHVVTEEIVRENGTLDKYIGDAVMGFWGAPVSLSGLEAFKACCCAIKCQIKMKKLRERWAKEQKPLLHCRIGVHIGPCVVGNLGSVWRLNYTIIGDSVNLASRLEGQNKYYGTEVLISEDTLKEPHVKENFYTRKIDVVGVKGKTKGCAIYELIGFKATTNAHCAVDQKVIDTIPVYEKALEHYLNGDFATALTIFDDAWRNNRNDTASFAMIERCKQFISDPPENWNGVYHSKHK